MIKWHLYITWNKIHLNWILKVATKKEPRKTKSVPLKLK